MSLDRSLGWGLLLAFLATVLTLVGFLAGVKVNVPGVIEISSSSSNGGATAELNLLAPLALAVVLGLVIWSAYRVRSSREDRDGSPRNRLR